VARLTHGRRIDLIVVFQSAFMKRVTHLEAQVLTDFFGDDPNHPGWRLLYEQARAEGRSVTRIFLDHYQSRLRSIGYREFHDEVSVHLDNNVPLNQMLFASKHARGQDFWKKISGKQHDGQLRMAL
jgi:hypothetical protein